MRSVYKLQTNASEVTAVNAENVISIKESQGHGLPLSFWKIQRPFVRRDGTRNWIFERSDLSAVPRQCQQTPLQLVRLIIGLLVRLLSLP